jgi:predicted unusual protein kinase regulating ubiquinone biosynthesis (AarF/ABC1/UbiB family)
LIGKKIDQVLELYVDVSPEKLRFGEAIGEVLQFVRRRGLLLPGTLIYFLKALAKCEGVLQNIDPDSSFADYLQPMVRKLIYHAFAGPDLLGRLRETDGGVAPNFFLV